MNYDVLVIGGGHAGVEAAVMARRLSMKVAIVTFSILVLVTELTG